MIPQNVHDLDVMLSEVGEQTERVEAMVKGLSAEALIWQSSPDTWSIAGHLSHMVLVNQPYLTALDASASRERARNRPSEGPYKHPWFGRWFANSMAPPPKRRFKTLKAMTPDPTTPGGDALADFRRSQQRFTQSIEGVRGLDLGRGRFSSPFAAIVRLSLGTGLSLILLHNRRHIWLIQEIIDTEGFPGDRD